MRLPAAVPLTRRGRRVGWRAPVWSTPLGRVARAPFSAWRRSLQLRVVATTLLLSLSVIAVIGTSLIGRITAGLLQNKVDGALAESSAVATQAQSQFNAIDRYDERSLTQLVDDVVPHLAGRGGPAGSNEVILRHVGVSPLQDVVLDRASNGISATSVPDRLRRAVTSGTGGRQMWTYVDMRYVDGTSVPGLAVGGTVTIPTAGTYELYFLYPLDKEQQVLGLVQRTLLLAGIALVALVGAVAWLVARQVVKPVRAAAGTAVRLASGHLEERMAVRGEDDLARLAASFNEMAASLADQINRLEELSRVQRRFVSDVSHELRTPLTTVRMAADVIHDERGSFDPATARSAELLQAQLDRFESLLADLLEISRFDAGAAVLDLEQTDLVALAARVIDDATPLAERTGCPLRLEAHAGPCLAEVDPRRITRVLRNLVSNALEHGEGRPVVVRVAGSDAAVAIGVRDYGVGLKPGEASLVFNRFWRADPARARTSGGTGLGLSIALEDARLHGGWLQAWGEPGGGCHFRLTVPRTAGADLDQSPIPLEPEDSRRHAGHRSEAVLYRRLPARETVDG